jgi:Domain of unknown function (DUF4032)/Lipopolysaccharide kinase (Kdo/WaaP) family
MSGTFELVTRPGNPDFLDLPWHLPLRAWSDSGQGTRLVDVARGLSRHVVRFVDYCDLDVSNGPHDVFALKELPLDIAAHEYQLLRALAERKLPVVEAVGVVSGRTDSEGEPLESILITRHLQFSLPYRHLFMGRGITELQHRFLDAMAILLVRLHSEGFFWGDCSLSNTLFRRDAGGLIAYLVDAETGVIRDTLSNGQREHDLALAFDNVGGELLDLAAGGRVKEDFDPLFIVEDLRRRYDNLWAELHSAELVEPGNRVAIARRMQRLNRLGFDVDEFSVTTVSSDGQPRWKVLPKVVESGHHQRRLLQLTGIEADENQARRLLNDLKGYQVAREAAEGKKLPEAMRAYMWLTDIYEPTIAQLPADLRSRLADPEIYHQILEHRWFLSEEAGHDVGTDAALRDYASNVLAHTETEEMVLVSPEDPTLIDGLLVMDVNERVGGTDAFDVDPEDEDENENEEENWVSFPE